MRGLITPRPGAGVCPVCFNFTLEQTGRCRACLASESHLSALVPVSYAAAGSELHRALADYKRAADPSVPYLRAELAGVLSRFLAAHERCVAQLAGVADFDTVAVVPSSRTRLGSGCHPLEEMVREQVPEVRTRYRSMLRAGRLDCVPHQFDRRRFAVSGAVETANVLLIDDVWTTGANAQSAAAVLREAGAANVAALVIGRYVNGHWGGITERLAAMRSGFRAEECAICCAQGIATQRRPPRPTGLRSSAQMVANVPPT